MRWMIAVVLLALTTVNAPAQSWQPVTEALIVAEKPGFGKLCGVVIDHATGAITINLSDKGFYRSTDQCKSWQKIGKDFKGRTETPGCLMLDPFGGKRLVTALVYGLSDLNDGRMGPIFGKNAEHLFVLTGAGILESTDGGKSWGKAGPVPREMKGVSTNLRWLEYDPIHDTLYVMGMGTELYQWKR